MRRRIVLLVLLGCGLFALSPGQSSAQSGSPLISHDKRSQFTTGKSGSGSGQISVPDQSRPPAQEQMQRTLQQMQDAADLTDHSAAVDQHRSNAARQSQRECAVYGTCPSTSEDLLRQLRRP